MTLLFVSYNDVSIETRVEKNALRDWNGGGFSAEPLRVAESGFSLQDHRTVLGPALVL